ncbi:PfkB family carbohydrate kinase [Amycolatopsis plumensis]|uniref:PfkB family carbohydrate kinase n=1 Tax=Amycolatopsis plumensis TaxID=236508 RepID=A0ABV5U7R5_9PSEU
MLNPAPVVPVVAELLRHGPILTPNRGEGVRYVHPGSPPVDIPPHPATVVDTTGAGDTFNGVLVARLAAGDPLDRAVRTANIAAALSVSAPGARAGGPTPAEVAAALAPSRR